MLARSIPFWFLLLVIIPLASHCRSKPAYYATLKANAPQHLDKPYVLLISMDGFRYDYFEKLKPPFLTRMVKGGVRAQGLVPVFPSLTFSSHSSIVTGVYPQKHGIVGNRFYAPDLGREYSYKKAHTVRDGSFYNAWTLWSWAEKNNMRSAAMFWPGSEAEIKGYRPSFYFDYDHDYPYQSRIKQIQKWLRVPPEYRPHFMTLYFDSVDLPSHKYGPEAKETFASVGEMDQLLESLMGLLAQEPLPVNVILVSDHGMQNIGRDKLIYLNELLPARILKKFKISGALTCLYLYAKDKPARKIIPAAYKMLKEKAINYNVYLGSEIPPNLHLNTPRAGDILIEPKSPYMIEKRKRSLVESYPSYMAGMHGFDPAKDPDMRGIFFAWGPNIEAGVELESVRAIDIAPLILKILDLPPIPNMDGQFNNLQNIYRPHQPARAGASPGAGEQ